MREIAGTKIKIAEQRTRCPGPNKNRDVCMAYMNEVPGMNIINKFADSLGMPVVNLNIFMMWLFVFAPENQLLTVEFGL